MEEQPQEPAPAHGEPASSQIVQEKPSLLKVIGDRIPRRLKTVVVIGASFVVLMFLIFLIIVPLGQYHGSTKEFFIGAVKVEWDYAANGTNLVSGRPFNDSEALYTQNGPLRIGSKYWKAVFRQFASAQFSSALLPEPANGLLGPVIRCEVGDSLVINVHNFLDFAISFQLDGPLSQGAAPSGFPDAATLVQPGQTVQFRYSVDDRAGPDAGDFYSVAWTYYSAVEPLRDFYSGLIGAVVVSSDGESKSGRPKDTDYEAFLVPAIIDENLSAYFDENLQRLPQPLPDDEPDELALFAESNRKYAINGFLYGNSPLELRFQYGKRVRWYVLGMGDSGERHTIEWPGGTLISPALERVSAVGSVSGSIQIVDLVCDAAGTFVLYAYGTDADKGMGLPYTIYH